MPAVKTKETRMFNALAKYISTALAAAALTIVIVGGCSSGKMDIVKNGQSDYAIVISKSASPSETHAAAELRNFIKESSGADIPLVAESDARAQEPKRIFIGAGELSESLLPEALDMKGFSDEGFAIRTVGKDIVIAGARLRGTMYGVYAFLEEMGFRWYTKEITKYPGKTLSVAALNYDDAPKFMYRVPWISEAFDPDWAARNRVHSGGDPEDLARGGKMDIMGSHSFDRLIPPSLYNEHPEYFPLIGGKRVTGYVQRCLSNPEVVKVAAENMIKWMDEEPGYRFFSLGQNDVEKLCECPHCQKILEEQGAPSGLFVHFANQVAELVAEKYPDNYLTIFAYTFSEKPPKTIRPHKNVIIRMAPIRLCFGHPFTECTSVHAQNYREHLDGWAKLTDKIFVWHYCTDFPNYFMPYPDFNEFIKDTVNYYERGVKGIYFQGTYTTEASADGELRAWLMSRLLWDPYQDADALINEWMQAVYGKAWEPMRANFDLVQTLTEPADKHLYIYTPCTKELWPDHVVASMDSLHQVAADLAKGDPVAEKMVRKNRLTVEYLNRVLNTGRLEVVDGKYRPVNCTVTPEQIDEFYDMIGEFGAEALREEGMDGSFYKQFRQRTMAHDIVSVENEDLRVDTVPVLGGRIVQILDKKTGKNYCHTGDTFYNYYPVYGGYDEITAWGWDCSGYANENTAKLEDRKLTLTATNPLGLQFTKVISLPAKGRKINFTSSIKNTADETQTYRLVTRMPFEVAAKDTKLETRMKNGKFAETAPTEEIDFFWPYDLIERRYDAEKKPAGAWKLNCEKDGWSVINTFDPKVVETCIWHTCKAKDMVRLDLHTADKEVKPGQKIQFKHSYEFSVK